MGDSQEIVFERLVPEDELKELLSNIQFRGLYDKDGIPLKPYANARFSLVVVHPPERPTSFPQIMHDLKPHPLFTAQPTIYKTQLDMLGHVDRFLQTMNKRVNSLGFEAVSYHWKGRGSFHVLPPVIEKHSYPLRNGRFDLKKIAAKFEGAFVKDAKGNLHELAKGVLRNYFVDDETKMVYMNIFNHNVELINYGLRFNGPFDFFIICDGSHRMDLSLEGLNQPTSAIVVESDSLFPYYALPMPFRPTTRLTSKQAESVYPKLERDKVHLFSSLISKVLHYDWEAGRLYVGKLRSKPTIF